MVFFTSEIGENVIDFILLKYCLCAAKFCSLAFFACYYDEHESNDELVQNVYLFYQVLLKYFIYIPCRYSRNSVARYEAFKTYSRNMVLRNTQCFEINSMNNVMILFFFSN